MSSEASSVTHETIPEVCRRARAASRALLSLSAQARLDALHAIAEDVSSSSLEILERNAEDVARARDAGMDEPLVDRLRLDASRIEALSRSVREIAGQPDPVGEVLGMKRRPNGLLVGQVRVPLGVVAMIYEARPNVTVDAAALTLKSGNAVLLRGGSDARSSNAVLGRIVRTAIARAGVPEDAVQVLPPLDREATKVLLAQTGLVDLVIPRGGEGLIRFVTEHARVPVIQHFQGVCHLYADEGCDHAMAVSLLVNGKARPGTCNATECFLVHASEAAALLPAALAAMKDAGVEVRGCARTVALVPGTKAAADDDWGREYLAKIVAVRVVSSLDEALAHVARYGSGHTEAICTRSYERSSRFLREVDASCVLVNASTRFNDGGELGLGAEIGISTSKLHAYGPMGAEHLTTRKWLVYGEGQTRGLPLGKRECVATRKTEGTKPAKPKMKVDLASPKKTRKPAAPAGAKPKRPKPASSETRTTAVRAPRSGPESARTAPAGTPSEASKQARERALTAASAGLEKKALDVEIIDVAARVDYADYLVLMTGTSDRHVASLVQSIEEELKKGKVRPLSIEGMPTASWVLVDYGDVVVHVFQSDSRSLYDVDGLWMDARRVPVPGRVRELSVVEAPPGTHGPGDGAHPIRSTCRWRPAACSGPTCDRSPGAPASRWPARCRRRACCSRCSPSASGRTAARSLHTASRRSRPCSTRSRASRSR